MPLFYAYAKNKKDDVTWRYLIIFASREVADEWWRAVTTTDGGNNKFAKSITRVNPEFYTHDLTIANIATTVTLTDPQGEQFMDKVIFTLLNDRDGRIFNVAPLQYITDHVSGNLFFIRSKVSPSEFWYCPTIDNGSAIPGTPVVASRTNRTILRVSIANKEDSENKTIIMIGSDEITITLPVTDLSVQRTPDGSHLHVHNVALVDSRLKFGDFKRVFKTGTAYVVEEDSLKGETVKDLIVTTGDGLGEEWELA